MVFKKRMIFVSLFACLTVLMSLKLFALDQSHNIFKQRREKLASMLDEGIIIIKSTESNQRNLYEFFVPNSDNHDFIYLTGLETADATLVLCPGSPEYSEILYIKGNHQEIKKVAGIEHVFPPENLMVDLSNAFTDFSLLRYTQRIRKPLSSEISRVLYNQGKKKVIYFNFPRFVNLEERPPERLDFIHRIEKFSPKYEIRDASDLLNRLRMYHDEYGQEQLRRAVDITGKAIRECMKSVRPGMTEAQLRSVFRFVCDFNGTDQLGFHTTVRSGPRIKGESSSRRTKVMKEGELIVIDCGAEVNHYTADIKRTFPVSGKFTAEQKKVYNILKRVQEACIRMVKPGVTMKDLQEKAISLLDEAGGYGKYFGWGTSHFLGMDVHDVGNNLIPFKPGIVITVEPGIVLPEFSVELEDDVLCTEDGYEWLSQSIPREVQEIEEFMKKEGIGKYLNE
ncbi:aminopeptidase P N-terminal domain-containing protein [bacterium]|nr:aminopeptidase P N-terminal domain-containing protein [bacterium]